VFYKKRKRKWKRKQTQRTQKQKEDTKMKTHATKFPIHVQTLKDVRTRVCNLGEIWNKYGKIPTKYGIPQIRAEKHSSRFVPIPETSVPHSVPFLDFSENTKTVGSNKEKRTVWNGKNSVYFQRYLGMRKKVW
jgi:hypothetical protein